MDFKLILFKIYRQNQSKHIVKKIEKKINDSDRLPVRMICLYLNIRFCQTI